MTSTVNSAMNQAMKKAITDAIKTLENKKYDTTREDFLNLLLGDMFTILFPGDSAVVPDAAPPVAVKAKKPRAPRKPKAPKEDVNISRLNPEQTKILKNALNRKPEPKDKKALLEYLNALDPEELGEDASKTFAEHVADYIAKKNAPAPAPVEVPMHAADSDVEMTDAAVEDAEDRECIAVPYEGKEYWVDPVTLEVFETQGDVDVHVGNVGLAKFAKMKITPPEDEE